MDKKTEILLRYINSLTDDENYKIIEYSELLSVLPKKYNSTNEDIDFMIDYLEKRGYIDVKHKDGKNICVHTLTKGKLYFENVINQSKSASSLKKLMYFTIICSGIMSFLGAFIAIYLFN